MWMCFLTQKKNLVKNKFFFVYHIVKNMDITLLFCWPGEKVALNQSVKCHLVVMGAMNTM